MTKGQKKELLRILIAAALFIVGLFAKGWLQILLMAGAWVCCGIEVAKNAISGIVRGQLLDENFLMTIASLGAFFLGESPEGAAVMIFFQVGELFEDYAVNRSRQSIAELMDLRPDKAVILKDGVPIEKDPEEVEIGDLLRVLPGERVPVDGAVVNGTGWLDTSKITGESEPRSVEPGSEILSGCVNLSGVLTVQAKSAYAHSTVARILELVESASEKKAKAEQLITRFAQFYTPAVVLSAVLLAVIPPVFLNAEFTIWLKRALTFLVISCPCALVISVPLSFFGGMGAASKRGIIVKGGVVLEQLAKMSAAVFDKTGTLTTGEFSVTKVCPNACSETELLQTAAAVETYSAHPAAKAICIAAGEIDPAERIEELPGLGVSALLNGKKVLAGNPKLMRQNGIASTEVTEPGTVVHISADNRYLGYLLLQDTVKPEARGVMQRLSALGVSKKVMLTGDAEPVAKQIADTVQLSGYYAGLLPQDKVNKLEEIQKSGGITAFVGDGVNDAPVLTLADIGIAMGGVGSDAAVEASDVVILNDRLSGIPEAILIGRKTLWIAKENILFALSIKFLFLLLSAFGYANMWMAVFADVGVAILAILNAMRALYMKTDN